MKNTDRYYYSGGNRYPLEDDPELVAVDKKIARRASPDYDSLEKALAESRPVKGEIFIVERERLSDAISKQLDEAGALHPVFRHDGTLIVVLPEVRLAISTEGQVDLLRDLVGSEQIVAEIVHETGRQFVLRPKSGRGEDALEIANRLEEELHPKMAQARFVRIVPRPKSKQR